ncbi:hypothetical protein B1R32_101216 [Abditibacterium utsteinense]|uniref:Uncharacterized protein n=1 Tax=Abditibacterium utsteinense TaxID=1960156 RepID=A0A2S8SXF6_9BACT|nr:hypothetical protein [Abditibacterium utsteinense]PQV65474.1 hypothetical protein B1R32_101216 [Abditibacterium utsteinense]
MNAPSSYAVISTLFCFLLSVGAAFIAINLHSLLRTGQVGESWRVLIIASVLFALVQAVKLAEVCGVPYAAELHLSSIIELVFVLALAYAFYLQRLVFSEARRNSRDEAKSETEGEGEDEAVVSVYEA